MILLWQDPEGKTVSSFNATPNKKSLGYVDNSNVDTQKIATLEKKICEKDNTIVLLKNEITKLRGSDTSKPCIFTDDVSINH